MKRNIVIIGMLLLVTLFFLVGRSLIDRDRIPDETDPAEEWTGISSELCNPNADENTRRLMSYLSEQYGSRILSGQYCDDYYGRNELYVIQNETGKLPAVVGFDFIRYSTSMVRLGETSMAVEWAIEEAGKGAVITFCWHWNPPEQYLVNDVYNGARTENTTIDLDRIMNGEDESGYQALLADMDAIALQLQRLQEEGIPVIWRPLHEASGGWFWWGDCSPESYIALYRLMYERYTDEWELNNLIWLWNGQDAQWYPGDDVVDLIGEDIYSNPGDYDPHRGQFVNANNVYTDADKMVVLSETAPAFDPELAEEEGAMWGFFGMWGGSIVCDSRNIGIYSESYLDRDMLYQIYHSDLIITRDELPVLR